jgi:hypothetical protein
MNEIRVVKDPESLKVEVLPRDPENGDPGPSVHPDPIESDGEGAPPPAPGRIEERRVAHRYRATQGRCWIGWNDGVKFHQSAAWLLNISLSGGLVATDAPPPTNRSVWLRLDDPAVPDWTEARIIEIKGSRGGLSAARLVFRGSCPYALMKVVAFGASAARQAPPGHAAYWNPNTW